MVTLFADGKALEFEGSVPMVTTLLLPMLFFIVVMLKLFNLVFATQPNYVTFLHGNRNTKTVYKRQLIIPSVHFIFAVLAGVASTGFSAKQRISIKYPYSRTTLAMRRYYISVQRVKFGVRRF